METDVQAMQELINSGRMAGVAVDYLVTYVQNKRNVLMNQVVMKFKSGEMNFVPEAAQLAFCQDLLSTIQREIMKGNDAQAKVMNLRKT